MPTFQIGLDDGRTLRIDADSHDAALAGAQHFMENGGPRTNAPGAAAEGFLDTAGLGFRDEIRGLAKASGLPEWAGGGWRAIPGAIELGIEKLRGTKDTTSLVTGDEMGPVERAYKKERDFTRGIQKQAQEEHPSAYLTGQVGGGVASALTASWATQPRRGSCTSSAWHSGAPAQRWSAMSCSATASMGIRFRSARPWASPLISQLTG
jgi:hypothetical protein